MENNVMIMLPQEEWDSVKNLLHEIIKLLTKKADEERKSEWIESDKARKMLGVCAKTWQTYRDKRFIPFYQFGRKILVRKTDLEAFLSEHKIDKK